MKQYLLIMLALLATMMLPNTVSAATEIEVGGYVSNYSGGEWMFALTSSDGRWYAVYYVQVAKDALVNGKTYTTSELKDSYANYLSNPTNPSATPVTHNFKDCSLTIQMDVEKKKCTILATFTSMKDNGEYVMHYDGKLVEDPQDPIIIITPAKTTMEDDEASKSFSEILPAALCVPYVQPKISDREIEIRAYDAMTTTEVSVVFNVMIDDFDNETYVPEGVYTINDSRSLGTVYAGQGHTEDNSGCVGTYAAKMAGDKVTNRWYVRTGTVTVAKVDDALSLVLDGVNSQGQDVHVQIGSVMTGVHDGCAQQAAVKTLQAGKVMIVREGVMYDMMGREVKD